MNIILFFGIKRSGNHGIIQLIINNYKKVVHINACDLLYDNYLKYKDIEISKKNSDYYYVGFKNADCVVFSVENNICDNTILEKFLKLENISIIFLLRNPFNNYDSWRKNTINNCQNIDLLWASEWKNMWLKFANFFLEKRNDIIYILYDKFYSDKKYQINILNKLSIDLNTMNLDKKYNYTFSSFDDVNYSRRMWGTSDNLLYKDNISNEIFSDKIVESTWIKILK